MTPGGESEAKGTNFTALVDAMVALYGRRAPIAMGRELQGPLAELIRADLINEGKWYPAAFYRELHRSAEVVAGEPVARELGRLATKALLGRAYRVFARILGPETSWRHSAKFFRSFYRPGGIEVLDARRERVRARISGCAGFDDRIWDDVIGSMFGVIEVSGGRGPQAEVLDRSEDGTALELEITWRR